MIASHTTDFPRPSIQFTAAGFLSEQKLPEKFKTQIENNESLTIT
jgi:hypothetical protein